VFPLSPLLPEFTLYLRACFPPPQGLLEGQLLSVSVLVLLAVVRMLRTSFLLAASFSAKLLQRAFLFFLRLLSFRGYGFFLTAPESVSLSVCKTILSFFFFSLPHAMEGTEMESYILTKLSPFPTTAASRIRLACVFLIAEPSARIPLSCRRISLRVETCNWM